MCILLSLLLLCVRFSTSSRGIYLYFESARVLRFSKRTTAPNTPMNNANELAGRRTRFINHMRRHCGRRVLTATGHAFRPDVYYSSVYLYINIYIYLFIYSREAVPKTRAVKNFVVDVVPAISIRTDY